MNQIINIVECFCNSYQRQSRYGSKDEDLIAIRNLIDEYKKIKKENEALKEHLEISKTLDTSEHQILQMQIQITAMEEVNIELQQQNEQLKEALMDCDPFTACNGRHLNVCVFCGGNDHADDCEYIRLCKT